MRSSENIYKIMGSAIYSKATEEITKEERFVGKTTILGCGYGMGPPKFAAQLKTFGTSVEDSEAAHIASTYLRLTRKNRQVKKTIVALIAASLVASNVFAFELPWRLKEFDSFASCMNFVPKFQGQLDVAEAACEGLFKDSPSFSRDVLKANRKFFSCLRTRVENISTPSEGRTVIFKCAKDYEPTVKTWPMNLANGYFPTSEELRRQNEKSQTSENKRNQEYQNSQEQIRRNILESEKRSRDLDRAFKETNRTECITIGNDISCF